MAGNTYCMSLLHCTTRLCSCDMKIKVKESRDASLRFPTDQELEQAEQRRQTVGDTQPQETSNQQADAY